MSVEQDEPSSAAPRPTPAPGDKLVAGGPASWRPVAGGPEPERPVAAEPASSAPAPSDTAPSEDAPAGEASAEAAAVEQAPAGQAPVGEAAGIADTTVPDGFAAPAVGVASATVTDVPVPEVLAPVSPRATVPDGFQPTLPPPPLPPSPGAVPPGPGGRPLKLIVAGAVAAAVVVAGVGALALTSGGGTEKEAPKKASPPPSSWALGAGRQLTSGPGLRYDGTLTVDGRPVQARLRVTRAGSASGTLTAGALKADVVAVDGVTYLRAPVAFWRDYAGETSHPDNYAGRWAKAPASLPGFDVPDVLGPKSIAGRLARAKPNPPTEDVNGVRAYRVKTDGADYLVTAAAPHALLAVRAAGPRGPRFTSAPLGDPVGLFSEVRARVAGLGGAADPGLRFAPGKLEFVNCNQNTNGCTVSVPAVLSSPEGDVPRGARAALRTAIVSKGRPLGSCTGSEPVPSGRRVELRCTVTGRPWRTWMKAALDKPGPHPYEAQARVVGEAVALADVPRLLAKIDKERGKKPKPTVSARSGE
ncbi:hypothetical protein [Actinomadura litoris]|uniref:Uncharacterized protein n=1 Tax=Actinomadura litoris TaxID=2678616 RepID=A0A7K1LDE7_9ACTN|nr:hypothetical protein [Actinomadura litoris]MUN42438.1 hypothetical protein [Actinomadura litoris]